MAGKSYYIVEVEALLKLVRASDDPAPHLFLLDELFRGTNAVERVAAGQAGCRSSCWPLQARRSRSPRRMIGNWSTWRPARLTPITSAIQLVQTA
jgi:hypothetical protein